MKKNTYHIRETVQHPYEIVTYLIVACNEYVKENQSKLIEMLSKKQVILIFYFVENSC